MSTKVDRKPLNIYFFTKQNPKTLVANAGLMAKGIFDIKGAYKTQHKATE